MLLVAAIAVPALLLVAILTFQAYRNERASVAAQLLSTSRAIASVVDGEVDEAQAILGALASTNAIQGDNMAGLEATARRTLAKDERWFVVLDPQGQELVNTRRPPGEPLPKIQLPPDLLAEMKATGTYVSNLRHASAVDAMVVDVSRLYVKDGAIKYILVLVMRSTTLARALDIQRYAPHSVLTIADRDGIILARSRNGDKFVGKSVTPDILAAIRAEPEGTLESVTLEKIPVLTTFAHANCGWAVALGSPKLELYQAARRLLELGFVCAGLVAFTAVGLAYWIGRALVRSVDALAADADLMARGNMPAEQSSGLEETDFVARVIRRTAEILIRRTRTLELLNRVNTSLVAEHDLEKIVQTVTDASREACGAAFGAFFYNVENEAGESYLLYTLSGAPRAAFERFGTPRNTPVFAHTFEGKGVVRSPDITADPRYGQMPPHHGMPKGHLPVRSYLAVPVKSRTGEVIGALFFGHPGIGVFTEEGEKIVVGLANEASIAIDNAKLYHAVARELQAKTKAESDLRVAQQRLHEYAQELEKKVEERTASLREAITQMEEFSYTVSHDLRSPLRAMNGYAVALMEDYGSVLDETGRSYLERIQRASERMDRLTTDVLSYSRVVRAQVQLAPTNVEKLVRTILDHYGELHPGRADVTVVTPLDDVYAHEPSLNQCIANLLTNAVKFTKPGRKPKIRVRTERRGQRVRLWVEDEGIGIPQRYLGSLFRIFERVPTDVTYEGNGVGLAIVRKAAEKMGGDCGVESDGLTGSKFWLELGAV